MGYLGPRSATGVLSAANRVAPGAWVITFSAQTFGQGDADFEIWHGVCRGPGGYFETYVDDTFFGVGENGSINEYAPTYPCFIRRGQSFSMHWSIATGTAPTATLFLREPEIGIFS